jgi:hypothetical protein
MRGFPFTQTPVLSSWNGEPLFYRTLSLTGKLTLGFEKGKDKSAVPTFMCKLVHQCVNVIGTKELFTCILIAVRVDALERYLQGR